MNGHHQTGSLGPFRAKRRSVPSLDDKVLQCRVALPETQCRVTSRSIFWNFGISPLGDDPALIEIGYELAGGPGQLGRLSGMGQQRSS
jgi:hypothetical protein